jgi:NAD(P)-dependent dehydrogenase (short-subunit alcohol dehydrogenase family)
MGAVMFIHTDIGDERSVTELARQAIHAYGKVDIVLNNATFAPLGAVIDRPIRDWDASYRANLRGPVLLAQAFLPGMIQRDSGVFACVSSAGGAYMGAYETLKSAQVELAQTLDAELEGKGVIVFTIGPGMVPTATMTAGVAQIAPKYGKTTDEFYETYKEQWLSVEAAGAGFAAAVALAPRYRGMETYSAAGLIAAGIVDANAPTEMAAPALTAEQVEKVLQLCREVRATLTKEHEGWVKRSIFERQWMLRDFKQHAGLPVDQAEEALRSLEGCLENNETTSLGRFRATVASVEKYYQHYQSLTQGAVKDPEKAREWTAIIQGWRETAQSLEAALGE